MEHEALTHRIIGCAFAVHRILGPGFLETVYRNALVCELQDCELSVDAHRSRDVLYRGTRVGRFVADVVVNDTVIVEVKAVQKVIPVHEAQLINYLTATGLDVGLLVNFGADRLEYRRRTRTWRGKGGSAD